MSPVTVIYLIWSLWFAVWLVAAVLQKREPGTLHGGWSFLFHAIAAVAVLFLLTIVRLWPGTDIRYQLWAYAVPDALGWVLAALALGGFSLSVWGYVACIRAGTSIAGKGPYALVRHPVYLGVIVAAAATALLFGQPTSLFGGSVLLIALIAKVLIEEHLAQDAAHCAYRQRVPMFVPFWPMGETDELPRGLPR